MDPDDPATTRLRKQIVETKPFLRKIYLEWYARLLHAPAVDGTILELGSGAGFFRGVVSEAVTSGDVPLPGNPSVIDARRLPFRDGSLRVIVMTDVMHHISEPRVSWPRPSARSPGGRMLMIEPWVSGWSKFVYMRFHPEPFRPEASTWEFPRAGRSPGRTAPCPGSSFTGIWRHSAAGSRAWTWCASSRSCRSAISYPAEFHARPCAGVELSRVEGIERLLAPWMRQPRDVRIHRARATVKAGFRSKGLAIGLGVSAVLVAIVVVRVDWSSSGARSTSLRWTWSRSAAPGWRPPSQSGRCAGPRSRARLPRRSGRYWNATVIGYVGNVLYPGRAGSAAHRRRASRAAASAGRASRQGLRRPDGGRSPAWGRGLLRPRRADHAGRRRCAARWLSVFIVIPVALFIALLAFGALLKPLVKRLASGLPGQWSERIPRWYAQLLEACSELAEPRRLYPGRLVSRSWLTALTTRFSGSFYAPSNGSCRFTPQ